MIIGKKYKLPPEEAARYQYLLTLHCQQKLPPAQEAELDRLQRKSHLLLRKHPKMAAYYRWQSAMQRKTARLVKRLEAELAEVGIKL